MVRRNTKFPGLRVLLVEDYFINQEILKEMLLLFECDVEIVEDGVQAIEIVKSHPFELILMDVLLPNMDGLETTRKIRAMQSIHPVIIAVTANAMVGDKEKCIEAGMDGYLSKPVDIAQLESTLKKFFPDFCEAIETS